MATTRLIEESLELARLLEAGWAEQLEILRRSGVPLNVDDPEPEPDPEPQGDPEPEPEPEEGRIDWKAMARKHEGRAKKSQKELEELKTRLQEIEDSNKSEGEKALAKAREEARAEAKAEAEAERRDDRLELATTRLAAKGVEVDDKTVKFADPEDAHVFIERAIARGDLDADDIFDSEGKVQTDALSGALADLLKRKPNLAADGTPAPAGDSDAGKGKGSSGSLSTDPEEHFQRLRKK
ncbi:MAG: hypothetical protein ACXVHX_26695 [Solirubrobacteraceae bacterium]